MNFYYTKVVQCDRIWFSDDGLDILALTGTELGFILVNTDVNLYPFASLPFVVKGKNDCDLIMLVPH